MTQPDAYRTSSVIILELILELITNKIKKDLFTHVKDRSLISLKDSRSKMVFFEFFYQFKF